MVYKGLAGIVLNECSRYKTMDKRILNVLVSGQPNHHVAVGHDLLL